MLDTQFLNMILKMVITFNFHIKLYIWSNKSINSFPNKRFGKFYSFLEKASIFGMVVKKFYIQLTYRREENGDVTCSGR